jgi:hypothetical protein
MSHYHDSDDLKILGEIKTLAPADFAGLVAGQGGRPRRWGDPAQVPRADRARRGLHDAVPVLPRCARSERADSRSDPSRDSGSRPHRRCAPPGAAVTHGALALKLFDQVKGDQR